MPINWKPIQQRLIEQGFPMIGGADGKFQTHSKEALMRFQAANGLKVDGFYGELTKAALFPELVPDRSGEDLPTFKPLPMNIKSIWPVQKSCMAFYGGVGLHQTALTLPYNMRIAWDKNKTINKITVHEKVHDSAKRCFQRIADAYDENARKTIGIDLFGGSLNVRKMRGGNSYSMHSWGIAIDFDPERNQLKWGRDKARLAKKDAETFWRIWEDEGWVALGRARNFDWMHVQAARL